MAKGTHADGDTFQPKLKTSVGSMETLGNTSEQARRKIMGLRMQSTGFGTDVKGALTKAPK